MRIGLRQELEPAAAYAVLCHELAHIYLGHLGADKDGGWPYRLTLPYAVTEIEAEAVSHIVCRRTGLRTRSAEYLSSFVEEDADLESISLDLVSRAAARIEEMGRRLLPSAQSGRWSVIGCQRQFIQPMKLLRRQKSNRAFTRFNAFQRAFLAARSVLCQVKRALNILG